MYKRLLLCLWLCVFPLTIMAESNECGSTTLNPLNLSIRLNLPNDMTTLVQAALYVLGPTGYRLAIGHPASADSPSIVKRPIPPEAFSGRVMSVADALLLFVGPENQLLIDSKHKLISFERIPEETA